MGSPLPPLSLSFLCPLPLSLYHMQILVIFFKCCLLLPCIQFLPGALACVPAFSHFSIFHVRFVVVADDTTYTHSHTHTRTHTRNMLHTTLVCESLCCLHFHYFFYVIFSLLPFFFSLLANNSHRLPKGSIPYSPGDKFLYACAAAAVPCKCLHSKLPMGQWTVCVLLRCAALLPLPAVLLLQLPLVSFFFSLSWLLGFLFSFSLVLSTFCICQLATQTLTVLCRN